MLQSNACALTIQILAPGIIATNIYNTFGNWMILYILKYCLSLIKQAILATLNKCKLSLPDIIIIIIRMWRWVFAGVRITLLFTMSVISPLLHVITHIVFAYDVIRPLITYFSLKPWTKKPVCLALNKSVCVYRLCLRLYRC